MSLIWRNRFTANITILTDFFDTVQGGYPQAFAKRYDKFNLILKTTINDSTTTVVLANTLLPGSFTGILPGTVFTIGTEQFLVLSVSGPTMTVDTRGYNGTTPAAHTAGDVVTIDITGDGVIDLTGVSWGAVTTPATVTASDICFLGCSSRDGTFVPIYDQLGALLTITNVTTDAQYYIPGQVFACGPYIKMRTITADSGDPTSTVAQAQDTTFIFAGGE